MESGEYKVGLDTLFKILHVFELSMSRFFDEAAETETAETSARGDAAGTAGEGAPELREREQLLEDLALLSDDSRREVREFIAFKRQQAEARRPQQPLQQLQQQWPPKPAQTREDQTDDDGE
jgi:hypothetical protein